MGVQAEQEPRTAGELIRFWRTRRGLSQLELSLDANVSTKHLSFVETGRSSPSRQLLVHLAQHLDLPITERNRLLLAGGFAPPYLELPYDGEVMQPLRESLGRLLEAHEPNPALIVDGLWNLIESNRAASLLWDGVDPELLEPPINMLRLGVHPGGLPRISSMTAACNAPLIHRLKRRSREDADPALAELIEEVESYLPGEPPAGAATQPVVSLRLQTPVGEVELFTVIATLGAPLDVTAANLAIETFLPMNVRERSAARRAPIDLTSQARRASSDASGRVLRMSPGAAHPRRAVRTASSMCPSPRRVRIRRADDLHPAAQRVADVLAAEVQAGREAVDLERDAALDRERVDAVQVQRVLRAAGDEPARRMAQAPHMRIAQRLLDPPGHRLPRHPLAAVDARLHPVELREDVVGQIEPPVGEDVALDPVQHAERREGLVRLRDLLRLPADVVAREPADRADGRRVVADRHVLVAAVARRPRHLLDVERPSDHVLWQCRSPRMSPSSSSSDGTSSTGSSRSSGGHHASPSVR